MADDTSIPSPTDVPVLRDPSPKPPSAHLKSDEDTASSYEMVTDVKKEPEADDRASEADENSEPSFTLKTLTCPICKLECGGQSAWDEHLVKHGLPLRCFYCQDVLPTVKTLARHRRECAKKGSLRACSHCTKTFTTLESLLTHEYLVHPSSSEDRAVSRERSGSREPRYQMTYTCSVCYEKHEGFQSMQRHLQGHLESLGSTSKDLECHICSIVFVSKAALSTHVNSPRHRERIMRIKNLFKCNHCGTVFPSRDGYAMHMLDIAREESENDLARRTIGLFTSMNTMEVPKDIAPAQDNPKINEPIKRDELKVPSIVIKKEPIDSDYEANENAESCDGGTSSRDGSRKRVACNNTGLQQHFMAEGYKCGLCGKRLEDQDSFAMHMMHHARAMEEQSQKQRIIGKVPDQPLDLRPMKREPGDGPDSGEEVAYAALGIVCPHCTVPFVTRDALAMHMMEEHSHKAHGRKSSLQQVVQHDSQPIRMSYPCQVCGRSFNDQDTLAMHMLMHSQSELLLLAQKPSSTISLSELSGSPGSNQSATSPSQSQSDDWQKSILNALYTDLPGLHFGKAKPGPPEVDGGQSESASTRSCGSTSDAHVIVANPESNVNRRRNSSLETTLNHIPDELYPGQYDRNIITYDKEGHKWTCSVCCAEFRSLISVTRHLGHVSHKLELEKRLRDVMLTAKSTWQTTSDTNTLSDGTDVTCRACGKRFLNRAELSVHVALLCRGGASSTFLIGKALRDETTDYQTARPRSTQSCHERPITRACQIRKRRCSEDLWCRERRNKLQRQQSPFQPHSDDAVRLLAGNRKTFISSIAWNFKNPEHGIRFNRPASVDSCATARQGSLGRAPLQHGVSEADSNTDNESNTDVMDFILKQKELFMCKFCKIIFTDKTLYYLHMGLHNLNNPWQCNLCGKPCLDVHEFSSHVIHF